MQQKIELLQAQLGELKGKSKDTSCVSVTLNPLSQKLENEKVELEFQVFDQKDTTRGTSANTKFAKQSILGKPPSSSTSTVLPRVGETHALSNPVTSNSIPIPQKSKVVKNDKMVALGMFRINPFKPAREENHVPNKVKASVRTNPITVSQHHVITKKVVNSDSNGLSSTGVDNTAKTRRPHPRSNTKNDRVPSMSKSSCRKNKEAEVEEHPRNLLLSKNKKHLSSEYNNVKLATQNVKSKKQKKNISINENQKKQKPKVKKTKKVGSIKRLALPKPSKPRSFLRWSPTGSLFDLKGKIIASSESDSQYDCSKGDNACTSNPLEPTIKRFPNSTFSLAGTVRFRNDYVAAILGFSDLQWGNILITRVYFVEGLGHNLFSIGQFCDSDLENQGDVNDAIGSKKKTVVVTSDPLALIAEKTNSANKKQVFVKTDNKRVKKKDDEKKRDMSRVKCYNCKKEGHFAKDCKKVNVKDYKYYKTKMMLAKKDKDEQDSGFELTGFSDADYARCKDTFKSTSSGAQFLGEKLLTDYDFHFNKIPIYCDSKSAIAISCNPVQHSRTKHIIVRYHFIKEHVKKGMIELYFVKTDYQLADLFNKALPVDRFNYLIRCLGEYKNMIYSACTPVLLSLRGIVPTEMELVLEQFQQGSSHEVLVSTEGVKELKRIVRIKGEKKEALHTTLGRYRIVDIEKVAVRSSLQVPNNKGALIESRANGIHQKSH
nr:hypothetical protein [Tanacetum cinerariifolium]